MQIFILITQLSLLLSFSTSTSSWPDISTTTTSTSFWPGTSTTTTTPSTGSFERIHLLLARNVQLLSSSSPSDYSRSVTCDDPNILPYVENRITENGALIITATSDCDVTIRAYTYQNIQINSVATLSMASGYSYKGFQLKLFSLGNTLIQINNIGYDLAELTFLGNSTVTVSGTVGKFTLVNQGKGSVDARSLSTGNANVTLTSTGSVRVKSTSAMNLIVNGTGTVLWCSPKVQIDVSASAYQTRNIVYQC
jgi:hypothetical protein